MDKLGEFASQMEKFLRSLVVDLGIDAKKGAWLAQNFTNESVAFDSEFSEVVNPAVAIRAESALTVLTGDEPIDARNRGMVSFDTITEFSKVSKILDADEFFLIGIYGSSLAEPSEWKSVSHKKTSDLLQLLESPAVTIGSIQGIVHAWNWGAKSPFFQLRQIAGGSLVRCDYPNLLHTKIHKATRRPDAVVHVYGEISWERITNSIQNLHVKDIEVAESISAHDFDKFFGSSPNFTGGLSTSEYISWVRNDED